MRNNSSNPAIDGRKGRSVLCSVIVLSLALPVAAHVGTPPRSARQEVRPLATIQQHVLFPTDVQAELAADKAKARNIPLRYAVAQKVAITPATDGTWEQLPDGRLWRLRIVSSGATDLNLGFTTFHLPEGATLHVMAEGENYYQGPYTAKDNTPQDQLWTPVVPGEAAVVELFVPAEAKEEPQLVLGQVGAGYRDLFHRRKDLTVPKAESCEIDVVCPQGKPWTNEIRSVARYSISGDTLCTGTLIADAAGDFRSYFLTANHCGLDAGNAASVVVYWNYQSPTCGERGGGSLAQNQSGAIFRAAKTDVDFALIELTAVPDPNFKVYYAGWDRSGTAPAGGVGIHHPNADEKSISFCTTPLTTVDSCIGTGGSGTHWQVTWSSGVTEPGSSGSGIWDSATHLLVGTLSGGGSDCATPNSPDCYGKFSVAWGSGATAATRLKDWLDPQNTGVTSIPGTDPAPVTLLSAAGSKLVSESCSPANGVIDPGETVTVSFALQNTGRLPTTNLVATLQTGGGVTQPSGPQTYGVVTGGGPAVSRSFTFTANGVCGGTITPVLQLQDGSRNLGQLSFSFTLGVATVVTNFTENFDEVTAPSLPAGWTTSAGTPWITSSAQRDTQPNSAFAPDKASISDYQLISPSIAISSAHAQLTFRHNYNTENGYDGGVLEISIGGGAFSDILDAGGSFVSGGYTQTIPTSWGNPLGGRSAWSGNSGGFVTVVVNLPAAAAGSNIQLRWRFGSDDSNGSTGWFVDTISVTDSRYNCCSGGVSDTLPPNLGITSYSNEQWVASSTIVLSGTASDAERGDNGIAWVTVNGVGASNDVAAGSSVANWSLPLNLSAGTNVITVAAADYAGNSTNQAIQIISDTVRPTVAISVPTNGQRWSNATCTVKGTARDNLGLVSAYWQTNGGPWMGVVFQTGTTNWTADLTLSQRTNVLKAYAMDPAGNKSLTNSVTFLYVVSDRLTVVTNGSGRLSPNYGGAWLEIGQGYSMTAVGANGDRFGWWEVSTNWANPVIRTNPTLSFAMQSNLTLTVVFVDTNRPTVAITNLAARQWISNAVFEVKGTARDNTGVSNVWYQLNSEGWSLAGSTNGFTNWTADLTLSKRTNLLSACAVDAAGNRSLTSSVTFFYVRSDRLALMTAGNGRVSPNYSNAWLEIGQNYALTATAGNGSVFSNWVGTVLNNVVVVSNTPRLTFTMQSNLVLLADFVPNPFILTKGTYNGLFAETNRAQGSSGFFTLTLTTNGAYSGSLKPGTNSYAVSGQFDVAGTAHQTIPRLGTNAWDLAVELNFAEQQLTGTVSNKVSGGWVAALLADRAVFDAGTNPATRYAGKYTLVIPGADGDASTPEGHGYAAITVDAGGKATLTGSLADSTNFSQTVPVSKDGELPVYASLYGGKGSVWSWLTFDTNQPATGLGGWLSWIRLPQPTARFYPAGFTNEVTAVGSRYTPPPTATNRVILMTNGVAVFEGGNLVGPVTNLIALTVSNTIINLSSNKLSLSLTLPNGLFSGLVQIPGTTRSNTFRGVLLQSDAAGYGYFLGTNQSGRVYFGP